MWIEDDNSVSSAAFKDSRGVSVDRAGGRAGAVCVERMVNALSQIIGVGRLTCEDVKTCEALPVYCPVEGNEYHSEIHDSMEQVQIKSKAKARKLAKVCQVVFLK